MDDILGAVDNLNVVLYLFSDSKDLDDYLKFTLLMCKKTDAEISLLVI